MLRGFLDDVVWYAEFTCKLVQAGIGAEQWNFASAQDMGHKTPPFVMAIFHRSFWLAQP